ncbi:MAG: hypothetical protein WCF19_05530 [Chlamydiales bacterium]
MSVAASSDRQLVFCPPPLGKPDPTQRRPSEGPDHRTRVRQSGAKGSTCWYAAYNLLRERYKDPNTANLSEERRFEQIASSLRKSLSAHKSSLPDAAGWLNADIMATYFQTLTKETIKTPQIQQELRSFDASTSPKVSCCSVLPGFLQQEKCENLFGYLFYLKVAGREPFYNRFFATLNINLPNLFEAAKQKDPELDRSYCQGKKWEQLDWEKKAMFLHMFAKQLIAERYNMQVSSWRPCQLIGHLITELQERGPLIVEGCFGDSYYNVPATNLNTQIKGRAVYGWLKKDSKSSRPVTGHTILLVGAEKNGRQELVYYIDPNDESDPSHPEKQRIFCMSYTRLTSAENICDHYGGLGNDAPDTVGYAVYRNKNSQTGDETAPS